VWFCSSFLLFTFFLVACSARDGVPVGAEVIELPGFTVKTGHHCESSVMMNALAYQEVELSESMINGLASAPAFIFTTEEMFPFLGGRTNLLKENQTALLLLSCLPGFT
jgi:hypothetical protein